MESHVSEQYENLTPDNCATDGLGWSSLILVRIYPTIPKNISVDEALKLQLDKPIGLVFVIDTEKYDPRFKMAGGHGKKGETRCDTAKRELWEETGLQVNPSCMRFCMRIRKQNPGGEYWLYIFEASFTEDQLEMLNKGDDAGTEFSKYFTLDEFYDYVHKEKFLMVHYDLLCDLCDADLILPLDTRASF